MTQAVFYLTHTSLVIQTEKKVVASLELAEFVDGDEVKDEAALTLFLKDHLEPLAKKIDQAVVVLGLGLLHQKAVEKDGSIDDARKELQENVSLPKESIQEKVIETQAKSYLLLTNKDYYSVLVKVARDSGIDVLAVLPLSLFSDGEEATLSKDEVKTILSKEELYEAGNFLEINNIQDNESEKKEKIEFAEKNTPDEAVEDTSIAPYETITFWNKSRLLLILGFLIVMTGLLGGLIYLQQTHQSILPMAKPTPTPTEAPTPTPTPPAVAKSDLTVEVQNGTGTPGQAAKAKGLMEGLEYTKITTGNADTTDHETTEVVFSSKVSESQQKEIKDLLLKSFNVVTTKVNPSATTDILITTGTEK